MRLERLDAVIADLTRFHADNPLRAGAPTATLATARGLPAQGLEALAAGDPRMVIEGPNCLGCTNYVARVPLTFVETNMQSPPKGARAVGNASPSGARAAGRCRAGIWWWCQGGSG